MILKTVAYVLAPVWRRSFESGCDADLILKPFDGNLRLSLIEIFESSSGGWRCFTAASNRCSVPECSACF